MVWSKIPAAAIWTYRRSIRPRCQFCMLDAAGLIHRSWSWQEVMGFDCRKERCLARLGAARKCWETEAAAKAAEDDHSSVKQKANGA